MISDINVETLTVFVSLFVIMCSFTLYVLSKQRHDSSLLCILDRVLENNDVTSCILLLRKYPYLANATFKDGYTPFLRACLYGNTQVVKYMLDYCKVDIRKCTPNNESAFYLAVYDRIRNKLSKDATCIHALYHANADIDAVTSNGYSAIQLAAMFGHTSLVRWLLSKKANTNVFPNPYVLARSQDLVNTKGCIKMKVMKAFNAICLFARHQMDLRLTGEQLHIDHCSISIHEIVPMASVVNFVFLHFILIFFAWN